MEIVLVLAVVAFVGVLLLVAPILGIAAFVKASHISKLVQGLDKRLGQLARRITQMEKRLEKAPPAAPPVEAPAAEVTKPEAPAAEPPAVAAVPAPDEKKPVPPEAEKVEEKKPEPAEAKVEAPKPEERKPEPAEKRPARPPFPRKAPPAPAAPAAAAPPGARKAVEAAPPRKLAARKVARDAEWWSKFEETVGKQWMTWAGVLAIFFGVGFFVKYAFDNDWISDGVKVLIGVAIGAGLLVLGNYFALKKMRALGQGIIGGGLAVLYVSLWAAYGYYDLVPQWVAFAGMVVVTIIGMAHAIYHDAVAVSFLATLGGLITPVLVSTGKDPRDALFAYLLLLDLGVLGVGFWKKWRALDSLAFMGTFALFTGWYFKFYGPGARVPGMLWLVSFYLVFLFVPFVYHLRKRTAITGERFAMAVANATVFTVYSFRLLYGHHELVLGFVALGMAAAYVTMGVLTVKRIPGDEKSVFAFIAMAVTFLTMSVPLTLELNGITIAWAVEAPMLLYLSYRFDYRPGRYLSGAVLMLAFGRVFQGHWPLHARAFTFALNTTFLTVIFVPVAAGVYAWIGRLFREKADGIDRFMKNFAAIAGGYLALVLLHAETALAFHFADMDLAGRCAVSLIWAAGAFAFLGGGLYFRSYPSRVAGAAALAVSLILATTLYTSFDVPADATLIFNARFLTAFAACVAFAGYGRLIRTFGQIASAAEMRFGVFLYGAAIGLVLLLHSAELPGHAYRTMGNTDEAALTALKQVSFVWSFGAMAYLLAGLGLRSVAMRIAGAVSLAVALMLGASLYAYDLKTAHGLFLAPRFRVALFVVFTVALFGWILRRCRAVCDAAEEYFGTFLYGLAITALLGLCSAELRAHALKAVPGSIREVAFYALKGITVVWALGALVYLAVGLKVRSVAMRAAGVVSLMVAVVLAASLYTFPMEGSYRLLLSPRFWAAFLVVIVALGYSYVMRRFSELLTKDESKVADLIQWSAVFLLFVLLSVDVYGHYRRSIPDPKKAKYTAQMALSLVWALYATALLVLGFWRRLRPVRFVALGLFGLTALKLVLVDMATVKQLYRIVAFMVVGVLCIGAAYLYHKVEKVLEPPSEDGGGTGPAGDASP